MNLDVQVFSGFGKFLAIISLNKLFVLFCLSSSRTPKIHDFFSPFHSFFVCLFSSYWIFLKDLSSTSKIVSSTQSSLLLLMFFITFFILFLVFFSSRISVCYFKLLLALC